MPLLALLALFIVVPLAELYVILKVGDAIGVPWTILLLAADSVLGSMLLRSQGRAVWRRFSQAVAQGRMPHPAISFFDPARELYGTARESATVLFRGHKPEAFAKGPSLERAGDRLRAE